MTADCIYWPYLGVYSGEWFSVEEEEWFSAWREEEFVGPGVTECCDAAEFPVLEVTSLSPQT